MALVLKRCWPYFRAFTGPLTQQGKKTVARKLVWTADCEKAFNTLKKRLTSAPVLTFADFTKPFVLRVDASNEGLGAMLSQEVDQKLRVVAYANRQLKNMQNYSSRKRELLALKWSVTEKFTDYLLGSKFTVFSGEVQAAVDEVIHTTRLPLHVHEVLTDANVSAYVHSQVLNLSGEGPTDNQKLQDLQKSDHTILRAIYFVSRKKAPFRAEKSAESPETQKMLKQKKKRLIVTNGVFFRSISTREQKKQLVVPQNRKSSSSSPRTRTRPSLNSYTMTWENDTAGKGKGTTGLTVLRNLDLAYRQARRRMQDEATAYCKHCRRCNTAKAQILADRVPLQPILATRLLEIVAMDFTVMEPAQDGTSSVLVLTDMFTKFTVAVPTRNQTGSPAYPVRQSAVISELCNMYGMEKWRTTPYRPQGNAQTERFNRTLHNLLRNLPEQNERRWTDHIQTVVFRLQCDATRRTGIFFLLLDVR